MHVADAVALRQAGLTVPVLCLLAAPGAPHEDAIRHDVDLSAGSADLVTQIAAAASRAGQAGPAAPQGGHRDVAGRRDRRRLA